jgi:hypothetical protein
MQGSGRCPRPAGEGPARSTVKTIEEIFAEMSKRRQLFDRNASSYLTVGEADLLIWRVKLLEDLLRRADDVLKSVPPPLSDLYTNGLEPDIRDALRASP